MADSKENSSLVSIKAESLRCERNDIVLFEDLDFEVGPAEVLQVNGANGSGKTSLLRILCGLSYPEQGRVNWCNKDIHEYRAEYQRELVYIAHANAIKSDLNLLENLRMNRALCGRPGNMSLPDILARMALDEYADTPAGRLSSGQRRRLALARLLVAEAGLWILDEPLNSLDEQSKNLVSNIIREHVEAGGSVVVTSHEEIDWGTSSMKEVVL